MRWQDDECCWRSMQDTNSCSHHGQDPWSAQCIRPFWLQPELWKLTTCREHIHLSQIWPSVCTSFSSSHDSTTHTSSSSSYNKRGRNQKWWKWNKNDEKYKGKEKQGGRKRNKRWLLWLLFTAENLSHLMCTFSVYHQTIQKQEEIVPDKLWGSQPNNQLIRR